MVYDPKQNKWLSRSPMLQRRVYHSMAAVQRKLYVLGGNDLDYNNDRILVRHIDSYSIDADQWTRCSFNMLTGQNESGVAVHNGRIYLVGGYSIWTNEPLACIQVLDVSKEGKEEVFYGPTLPFASNGIAACFLPAPYFTCPNLQTLQVPHHRISAIAELRLQSLCLAHRVLTRSARKASLQPGSAALYLHGACLVAYHSCSYEVISELLLLESKGRDYDGAGRTLSRGSELGQRPGFEKRREKPPPAKQHVPLGSGTKRQERMARKLFIMTYGTDGSALLHLKSEKCHIALARQAKTSDILPVAIQQYIESYSSDA
ncbi:PREDICTED: uncharacterized protein LOC104160472 [Cariama cristata]|uniref:uncharacterized protein LOC104160472 n=1 Tax=Cariama cristata TaxID=54380 RepID=UPI0005207AAE|nr:PREDICTED: uncharacterized protein LOC104160472 [Cariama cristata]